ncbi:bifunctional DNA primase/polymerase [Nitratireductor aquibiodomus]|uniref:bifunctional DNA primase/polymerase n=1 Tax=Nitratireductor aquibiodomus TaxID=204799 RepID=UPI0019D37549|nr:bifunctional DNA primase/polymerase [Nitratireductor aquibiodomus]MBN7763641.1 bifunctional DNA primase/polymerase [Nitratireductor aquibiodomus]
MNVAPKQSTSPMTDTRLALLANGYRPLPCKGKFPAGFSGWQNCAATPENIAAWETTHTENSNTGILTGDVVAVDVDVSSPDVSERILQRLLDVPGAQHAPVRTGRDPKAMFFFRTDTPRDKVVTDFYTIGGVDQRIEVMGTGQQVIVDGIHPDTGKPYAWSNGDLTTISISDLPVIEWDALSEFLIDASAIMARHAEKHKPAPAPKRRPANDNGDGYFRNVNEAALANLVAWVPALKLPKTKRHGAGFRAVCAWRGVRNANLSFHPEGITDWGSGETHTAVDVVVKAGFADGVTSAAEWLCNRLGVDKAAMGWVEKDAAMLPPAGLVAKLLAKKAKPDNDASPFTPAAAGGLMGEISKWILDTSRRKSPELAVMASIAFMSAFYGRRVATPTGCGVNLYLAGIAGPGFGKEAPLQRLTAALQEASMAYLVGAGEVSSASSIEKILRRKPVVVMPWDEIGDVLEAINQRGSGNWSSTIRSAMLQLYSKSTGVWFGKETTDETRLGEPIYCPSMTIIGTSTPTRFYGGLSEKNLSDGFAARMIFVSPRKRPVRANPKNNGLKVPKSLLQRIKADQDAFPWPKRVGGAEPQWRVAEVKPALLEVPWHDEAAEQRWIEFEDWQEAEIEKDESRDGIIGRAAENAVRLATLRALSRGPEGAAVSVADVDWARAIVLSSIDAVEAGVERFMTSSRFEEVCNAIMAALRAAQGGRLYRAELLKRRGVKGNETRVVDDAIKRLQETGDIEKTDGKTFVLTPAGKG